MAQTETHTDEKFISLLKDFDQGMLVTRAGDDTLRARPMAVARREEDGTLYFITALHSSKVDELAQNPKVCVAFQKNNKSVTVSGAARVIQDRAKIEELWSKGFDLWFPDGPKDPEVCALVVRPDEGEYWDDAGWNRVKFALRAAKAFVTGERIEHDKTEHDRVKL